MASPARLALPIAVAFSCSASVQPSDASVRDSVTSGADGAHDAAACPDVSLSPAWARARYVYLDAQSVTTPGDPNAGSEYRAFPYASAGSVESTVVGSCLLATGLSPLLVGGARISANGATLPRASASTPYQLGPLPSPIPAQSVVTFALGPGSGLDPFLVELPLPMPVQLTDVGSPGDTVTVRASEGYALHWTGGDPCSFVVVWVLPEPNADYADRHARCVFPIADGVGTIPGRAFTNAGASARLRVFAGNVRTMDSGDEHVDAFALNEAWWARVTVQ